MTVACLVAAALAAGVALAKIGTTTTATIGTGTVVVDTTLGYEGGTASGTGIVLSSNGEILTNNHVIRGATKVKVVVPGTGKSYTATVVGYDVSADVAVLKATGVSNLKTDTLGDSSTVKVGQQVVAIGNANGTGTLTSARGAVTSTGTTITVSDDSGGSETLAGLLETNAGLEPGDSGGPLETATGRVIGMDTAAEVASFGPQSGASTRGYAIPIDKALSVAKLIEAGTSSAAVHIGSTAFLGIEVAPSGYSTGTAGVTVAGVLPGGSASAAGLQAGDVITSIGGKAVTSSTRLEAILSEEKVGAKVPVTYVDQSDARQSATVILKSGPAQ